MKKSLKKFLISTLATLCLFSSGIGVNAEEINAAKQEQAEAKTGEETALPMEAEQPTEETTETEKVVEETVETEETEKVEETPAAPEVKKEEAEQPAGDKEQPEVKAPEKEENLGNEPPKIVAKNEDGSFTDITSKETVEEDRVELKMVNPLEVLDAEIWVKSEEDGTFSLKKVSELSEHEKEKYAYEIERALQPQTFGARSVDVSIGDSTGYSVSITSEDGYHNDWSANYQMILIDGEVGFCVSPGYVLQPGGDFGVSDYDVVELAIIAYEGWEMSDGSMEAYLATQFMIWEVLGGRIDSTSFSDYSSYRDDIQYKVDHHRDRPSFNEGDYELTVGESVTIHDNNEVLGKFTVESTGGLDVRIDGNDLIVTATVDADDNAKIELNKILEVYRGTSILLRKDGSQDAARFMIHDPISVKISVKVNKFGSALLTKQDEDGTKVQNTTFKISKNSDMSSLVGTYTTGSDGSVLADELLPGNYYVQESSVPAHLVLDSTIRPLTITANTQTPYTATDRWKVGKVQITKKDVETGKTVLKTGTVFDIYKSDGTYVARITTNASGIATSGNLRYGDYYFVEKTAPSNYVLNGTRVDFSIRNDGATVSTSLANKRVTATLNLVKEDKDIGSRPQGDATLQGAVYGLYAAKDILDPSNDGTVLYKKDSLINKIITDKEAKGSLSVLYLGEYYWQEITPSNGYELDTTKYPVNPTYKDEKTETIVVNATAKETVRTGEFELIKTITDGNNSTIMLNEKGAEFTVVMLADYNAQGNDIQKALEYAKANRTNKEYAVVVTDKDGIAKSPKLVFAKYIVVQTKKGENGQETDLLPPFGFEVSESGSNTITKGTDTNGNAMEMGEDGKMHYHINNRPFDAYAKIIKRDLESGKIVSLNNTTFKIKMIDKNGNPVLNYDGKDESISQNEGIITDGEGNISMKVGFTWFDTFTTNSDNRIVIPAMGQYQEDAYADKGTVQLPVKLHSGDYRIDEILAPTGYILNTEPLNFHITANEVHQSDKDGDPFVEMTVRNQPVKGEITIEKKGEVVTGITKDENGNIQFVYETQGIAGMEAAIVADGTIYDPADGSVLYEDGTVIETVITKENGIGNSSKLPLGNYTVQEVNAPDGFVLDKETYHLSLNYEGQEIALVFDDTTIENERQKIETSITKKDKDNDTLLAGATFGLYAKEDITAIDGSALVEAGELIETGTTDGNGKYAFVADLPLTEYEIKEIKAPIGYTSSDEVITLDGTYQGQDVAVIVLDEEFKNGITHFEISKTDITTDKELAGNHLTVYEKDQKGNVFDTWVSTDEPHMLKGLEIGKTYVLHETSSAYGFAIANDIEFTVEDTDKLQKVKMENKIVEGRLGFDKTGEIFMATDTGQNEFGKMESPVWEESNLLNAKITIYAGEDVILGNDITYYHAGDEIETLVSDWETVYSKNLPVGKYYYVESKAPIGYVKDEEKHFFEIEDNQKDELQTISSALPNERPEYELGLIKDLEINDIENPEAYQDVVFGIYAREDIYDYMGNVAIEPDTMVMSSGITEDGKLTQKLNLPVGGYYVKELQTNEAYILDEKEYDFYIDQSNDKKVSVEFNEGKALYNELKDYKVLVNKVDSQTGKNVISKDFEFTRFTDEDCTKIVDTAIANTTDGNAMFDDIHFGITYIQESKAPEGYRLSDEVVKVEVNNDGVFVNDEKYSADDNDVYSIVYLNSLLPSAVQKIEPVITGDRTNLALGTIFVGLFMVSGFGIFGTFRIRAKRKKNEKNKE